MNPAGDRLPPPLPVPTYPLALVPTVRSAAHLRAVTRVRASPEADHGLLPPALFARTCTWYSVPWARSVTVALVPVTPRGPLLQLPLAPARYRTS